MKRLSLTLAPLLILCAIGLIVVGARQTPERRFLGELKDLLPPPPSGWTMKEKAIAETPEMQKAVGEILNFDDGIFVDYLGPGGERLSVYLAYWAPGRMSHRLVATHTPDVCWVAGGWYKQQAGDTSAELPDIPVGEARIFTAQGSPEHVWFWHLVGRESKRYGTGKSPPWHAAITDILRKGLNQREEQLFIRLSSDRPLQPFIGQAPLRDILATIPWPAGG